MKNVLILIGVGFIFLAVFATSRFYVIQITMQSDKLNNEYKRLLNTSIRSNFEIEELTSLKRLERFAFDTLNLKYPAGEDYESGDKKYSQR